MERAAEDQKITNLGTRRKRELELATQNIIQKRQNRRIRLFPPGIFKSGSCLLYGHDEIFRSSKK